MESLRAIAAPHSSLLLSPSNLSPLVGGPGGHSSLSSAVSAVSEETNSRLRELEQEIKGLRESGREMEKENEDLKGQILNRGVEEGKRILANGHHGDRSGDSIEEEMKNMTDGQVRDRKRLL